VSAAVHPNALHAANTNELNAYIIIAVALVGKVYQLARRKIERRAMSNKFANVLGFNGIVQAIGTEQQNVAGHDLIFAGVYAQKHVVAQRTA